MAFALVGVDIIMTEPISLLGAECLRSCVGVLLLLRRRSERANRFGSEVLRRIQAGVLNATYA